LKDLFSYWITNCIVQFSLRAIGKPMFASAFCLRDPAFEGMTIVSGEISGVVQTVG
jgi:hypothetical protein